jgi:hypothetical protein
MEETPGSLSMSSGPSGQFIIILSPLEVRRNWNLSCFRRFNCQGTLLSIDFLSTKGSLTWLVTLKAFFPRKKAASNFPLISFEEEKNWKELLWQQITLQGETLSSEERKNFSINTRREHKFELLLLQLNITQFTSIKSFSSWCSRAREDEKF